MAEFHFYATWEDSWTYLETLVRLGRFTFVENKWYTEPVPFQFKVLNEEVACLLRKPVSLFLWSDEYSQFPPDFGEPTKNGLIMIDPTSSGPALDLLFPTCFERDGRLSVGLGELGHQPQYQNPETEEWYRPPEPLKRAYNEIRALLRKSMVKRFARSRIITDRGIRPTIKTLWIGENAAAMLDAGKADILIGAEWMWEKGTELKKTRGELEPLIDEYA